MTMCGRFVIETPLEDIVREFGIEEATFRLEKNYNVAPTQDVPIVRDGGRRKLLGCRWGLIPQWARDPSSGGAMINARGETVADKPAFREAFRRGRCLVLADGFYEWKREGRRRRPYFVRLRSGRPMGFAGLCSTWAPPGGEGICTCTIITTAATGLLMPLHDRMPVIIPKESEGLWLDPAAGDTDALLSLLAPFPSRELEAYEVSQAVNRVSNNSPDNIRPLPGQG